jgi:carboxypeptidase T
MKIGVKFLAGLAALLGLGTFANPVSLENADILSVPKRPALVKKLESLAMDYLADWGEKIYILASPEDFLTLREDEIPFTVETSRFLAAADQTGPVQGGVNGAYHTYAELGTDLLALEQAHRSIARVFEIGESLEKRKIYALKISDNVDLDEDEAEVLFLGCHHAREWISVEVPFLLGKYLVENYAVDPEVKRLVDQSEIWIVPLVNPDGLEYTIHVYRYWRKNRRDNGQGSYGVDINRNYGYKWGYDELGSSSDPDAADYRGTSAFSEPETRAIRDLFLRKNFEALISYHSFSQVILYPWGYTKLPTDRDADLRNIAAEMSSRIYAVNGRFYAFGQAGLELYLTNGDLTDWTFSLSSIPSYTIELPPIDEIGGGFFNRLEDILPIFQENLPAALYLIDRAIRDDATSIHSPLDLGRFLQPGRIIRRIQ